VGTGGTDVTSANERDFSPFDHNFTEGPTPFSSIRLTYISAIAERAKFY
jgi:hypothetical protein